MTLYDQYILKEVVYLVPGNVFWKSVDGKFLGCNINLAKILGLNTPQEIIGKTNYDLFDSELAEKTSAIDNSVFQTGETYIGEEIGLDHKGNIAIYYSEKKPLYSLDGKIIGLVGISIDITDKRKAEQLALEKAEAEKKALEDLIEERLKTEKEREIRKQVMIFSGAIAHEQRTPLAILNIIAHVLKENMETLIESYHFAEANQQPVKPIPKRILTALEEFGDQINRLTVQMNASIDHSLESLTHTNKEDFGKEDLELCNLNNCMLDIVDQFPYQTNETQLLNWDRACDFDFLGNRELFSGMINNLLKNALEQIRKKGKGEIFISSDSDEKFNYLIIKDTTGGAAPEVMEKLFQGYMTTKKGGTGIGLAMCKLTMKNFGGDITAKSVYGDYMKFRLSFPKLI